jgi:hypothetical protein
VNSSTLKSFWQLFHNLPEDVRRQARQAFNLFQTNPFDPRLQFKEIKSRRGWWSVRIGGGHRALGERSGDTITWFWIGTHDDYIRRIGTK